MKKPLVKGKDFYFNDEGFMVFTRAYHIEKGACCGHGCKHCPYEYENVPELEKKAVLLKAASPSAKKSDNPI